MLVTDLDGTLLTRDKRISEYTKSVLQKLQDKGIKTAVATAWNAVKYFCELNEIEPSEVVAFGDDLNDAEMLEKCGVGVAMDNALDIVKESADFICGNNDEDGVAKWLETNL